MFVTSEDGVRRRLDDDGNWVLAPSNPDEDWGTSRQDISEPPPPTRRLYDPAHWSLENFYGRADLFAPFAAALPRVIFTVDGVQYVPEWFYMESQAAMAPFARRRKKWGSGVLGTFGLDPVGGWGANFLQSGGGPFVGMALVGAAAAVGAGALAGAEVATVGEVASAGELAGAGASESILAAEGWGAAEVPALSTTSAAPSAAPALQGSGLVAESGGFFSFEVQPATAQLASSYTAAPSMFGGEMFGAQHLAYETIGGAAVSGGVGLGGGGTGAGFFSQVLGAAKGVQAAASPLLAVGKAARALLAGGDAPGGAGRSSVTPGGGTFALDLVWTLGVVLAAVVIGGATLKMARG